jgi:phosphoserine aminotransferase
MIERARRDIPVIFRYQTHAENDSLYNTPPTFAIYMVRNVLAWMEDQGGLAVMEARNRRRPTLLYGASTPTAASITAPVEKSVALDHERRLPPRRAKRSKSSSSPRRRRHNMVGLKGHRSVGGLRASIYNAVDVETVKTLADFVGDFAKRNG